LHLAVTGLVAFSWFVLGAYLGLGYCPLTGWRLRVRRAMGRPDVDASYVQLLASEGFGLPLARPAADWLGAGLFALMPLATGGAWGREWWRRSGAVPGTGRDVARR
jgi:hypothetical protein